MTYDANKLTRIKDLKSLADDTKEICDLLDERTELLTWRWLAGLRNSIWRGKELGTTFTQWSVISGQYFTDMYLGDYWTLPSGKKAIIAGFNYYQNMHDGPGSVALLIETPGPLNSTEAIDATYADSHWFTETRAAVIEEIESFFGASRIPEWSIYVPVAYSGVAPSSYASVKSKLHMQTYSMFTGFSPYHVKNPYLWIGTPKSDFWAQLPLYRSGFQRPAYNQWTFCSDTGAAYIASIRCLHGRSYGVSKDNAGTIRAIFFVGGGNFPHEW